ncbi:MAG: AMP-binding protein [Anaerolineales bacterium]|nr:AMP-binding protein [Anaerolineales bacterium]
MIATVYSLIEHHSQKASDSPAIGAPGRDWLTYGQLFEQMQRMVRQLNALGVGCNDRVAIVLPNGPEMASAFLTVAAAAASAPLNPAYNLQEFDFYLSDLNARALVVLKGSDSPARQAAQGRGIPIIELVPLLQGGAGSFDLEGLPAQLIGQGGVAGVEDIALVLHTSGTTSRPKIVPLSQGNICASASNISQTLSLTSSDRCLNIMPLFHIHGLMAATLATITAGGSIVCTPGIDASRFFDWLELFQPTWYTAVPTMHQAILKESHRHLELISRQPVRLIRSSSASLPPQVMAELESTFQAPVIEAYGMTEAAHQMASNPLPPRRRKPGSVGPAAGPEVAIMDEAGALLASGEKGEIVIRGANVMHGYENNPSANQAAFTQGWFRTGDQGLFDEDGYLFITGRLKEIINRGGEKVTPREVDEVFMDHPAVSQAVTFAVPHTTLGEDVATAVVLKEGVSTNEKELRKFAFSRLADYKVPSQVIFLDQIPKGPTGKLQRIGLHERLSVYLKSEYELPQDEIQTLLVKLWSEVLGIDHIGINDNFFAIGGDSLKAMQVIARLRDALKIELPLGTIFREPTVAELALIVESNLLDEIESMSDEQAQSL